MFKWRNEYEKNILNPISTFVIGSLLGIISRLLDIYTQNLGNIFSPGLAYFTWTTKEKGILPKIISIGIILISIFSSIILFDSFRIYDLIINGLLIYLLLIKK